MGTKIQISCMERWFHEIELQEPYLKWKKVACFFSSSLNCQWMCLFKLDSIHKISAIQNLKFTSTLVKLLCLWATHELQALHKSLQWYFVSKIVLTYCEQKIVLKASKSQKQIYGVLTSSKKTNTGIIFSTLRCQLNE